MKVAGSKIAELVQWLRKPDRVAVAVSGGIDSLTLGTVAGRYYPQKVSFFHAVSPAVPTIATKRVMEFATLENWNLTIIDAKEFDNPNYISNPVNRCFYCKQSLYKTIAKKAPGLIISGTNADDLADYRPGLLAAKEHDVMHPFAELKITKSEIRNIARRLGFGSLAELPASPCLSSRIETGIPIAPAVLTAVYQAEQFLNDQVISSAVRCRFRSDGITIEIDDVALRGLDQDKKSALLNRVAEIFKSHQIPFDGVHLTSYRMGSAFLTTS
jgi:uncharacterized protein